MKKSGASDLWDVIIERYCSKEERKLINEMSEDDYSDLVFAFDDMLLEIENRIKRFGEGKKECFEKGYKIVDTMFNGYKQQAREEMLKEIRTKMTKKLKHYVPDFLTKSDFMMINQGLLKEIK